MTWRLATGFAPGALTLAREDVMRTVERGDERAIILANASSAPFELIAPPLSRAMLDEATAAWQRGARPVTAIAHGGEPLVTADAEAATGWMLFASLSKEIELAWIGMDEAWIVDSSGITVRNAPHALRATHGPNAPDVATRSLTPGLPVPSDRASWSLAAGARLICMSYGVARLDPTVAIVAATDPDLARAAQQLADAAVAAHPGRFATVVIAERG